MKASNLLFALVVASAPVCADSLSGKELLRMMQTSDTHPAVGGDYQPTVYDGYVLGVSDGLMGTSLYYYCPPVNVTRKQLRGVVTAYLKSHPNDLHVPGGALVTAALIEAYPCKKKSE
ncbi:MAG: hypothetical protein KGZ83_17965 [Sulfuricella sp.]|nr:hypothetical protein [Sulfuricella sp.]